jgi:hypothetical protein
MNRDFDLITLITNPDPVQVAIARDQLEQAGIQYQVRNQDFGGLYGQGPARLQRFAEPQLVVFRQDARRAAELLGIAVPADFDEKHRGRRPGIVAWLRWLAGLD